MSEERAPQAEPETGRWPAQINKDGTVSGPGCCGVKMVDDGGCAEGCCDDYRCTVCGKTIRVEWPD